MMRDPAPSVGRSYDDYHDGRIKHLELIQDVITRLSNSGFVIKGWCLTVSAALLGFSLENANPWLALLSVATTSMFWGLDTYFLRSERLFRALYGKVVGLDVNVEPFFMGATQATFIETVTAEDRGWRTTASRGSLLAFYLTTALTAVLVAVVVSSFQATQ